MRWQSHVHRQESDRQTVKPIYPRLKFRLRGYKQIIERSMGLSFLLFTLQYIAKETQVPHRETSNHFIMWQKNITTGVRERIFSNRQGDYNHLIYLTSVPGHRYLLSVPGQPPNCFLCRASAILDTKLHMLRNLDCESKHLQSRALLLVNGERGLLVRPLYRLSVSQQWRSHRASLVTRGTPVVPRRVWYQY